MNAFWPATRRWLARTPLARRIAEGIFRARSRRLLAEFEQQEPCRSQIGILLGLVHRAQRSPFGVQHDFPRIRTIDDFRRLVPLRSAAELNRFPSAPVIPLADTARRSAIDTALALVARERSRARLFDGSFVLLGDDLTLADDPSRVLPTLIQPFANVRGKVRCLIGSADRLCRFLEVCRPDDRVTPLAVLYTPGPSGIVQRMRSRLQPTTLVMELGFRPEAPITVEDPRQRAPRLLTSHGVFFEFVLGTERFTDSPPRLTLEQVEPGTTYELVISAPGGWWACRTGAGVQFLARRSALIRYVPLMPAAAVPSVRPPVPVTSTLPLSHPRTAGIPVERRENSVHIPWSAPAGRG